MAQTLDGKIAKDAQHFPDWTEKADKSFFMKTTKAAGVMIFGRTTFETLPGVLPGRLHVVMSRKAKAWEERSENLVFTNKTPQAIVKKLTELDYKNPILAGGTTINTLWAKAGLIDELLLTISPVLFGDGLGLFSKEITMQLQLRSVEKIGEKTLVTKYQVLK